MMISKYYYLIQIGRQKCRPIWIFNRYMKNEQESLYSQQM